MIIRNVLAVILMLAWSFPATADSTGPSFTGTKLLTLCQDESQAGEMSCAAYVRGLADGIDASREYRACYPDGVTVGQLALVVRKWLEDHPQHLHEAAGVLVTFALTTTFPCQKEPKNKK